MGVVITKNFPARKRAVDYMIIISGNPLLQILESPMLIFTGSVVAVLVFQSPGPGFNGHAGRIFFPGKKVLQLEIAIFA